MQHDGICPDISVKTGKVAKRTIHHADGDSMCGSDAEAAVTICGESEEEPTKTAIFLASFTLNGVPLLVTSAFEENGDYSKEAIRECVSTAIKGEGWCDTKETGCDLNDLKKAVWDKRYASCSLTKQNEQRQATSDYDVNDDNVHINHQRFKQVMHQHLRNK